SFIVAFDHPRWYSRPVYAAAAVILLAYMSNFRRISLDTESMLNTLLGLSDAYEINLHPNLMWRCIVFFSGLFVVCMICHCELAALKPAPRRLTAYFLTMSLGGAVGGVLINLLAPYVFVTFFELPLGILASIGIAAVLLWWSFRTYNSEAPHMVAGLVGAAALVYVLYQVGKD